jgi:dihydrolipoamide dehydrogenase
LSRANDSFFEYDMMGEIVLAIENGADAVDIGKTIHSQTTLGASA